MRRRRRNTFAATSFGNSLSQEEDALIDLSEQELDTASEWRFVTVAPTSTIQYSDELSYPLNNNDPINTSFSNGNELVRPRLSLSSESIVDLDSSAPPFLANSSTSSSEVSTSLIPVSHSDWTVILHHEPAGQMVLYSETHQKLALRKTKSKVSHFQKINI